MELVVVGFMCLVVVGGALGVFAGFRRRAQAETLRRELWRAEATRRGGQVIDSRGLVGELKPDVNGRRVMQQGVVLEVPCGEALVRVDTIAAENNDGLDTHFHARWVLGWGAPFSLHRRDLFGAMSTALSKQGVVEVSSLDAAFDVLYTYKSSAPNDVALGLMTEGLRRAFKRRKGWAALDASASHVRLRIPGAVRDAEGLAEGIELIAEVASQPESVISTLRALDGGQYTPAHGHWDDRQRPGASLELRGSIVRLTPKAIGDRLGVEVTTRSARALSTWSVIVGEDSELPDDMPDHIVTPHAADHLATLGWYQLHTDADSVSLNLAKVDERRLMAAAQAVVSIASESSQGAFR